MTATTTRDPARHRAALIHLIASIVIVGAVLAVPFGLWYPGALRPLSGIDRHLLLLFAAVLAVGPALTWLVYRTGKRTLKMDITVVVLIQLLFLGYASLMLARLRPVYLVGMERHIELVRAADIDRDDLAAAVEERRALPWSGPVLVGALPPAGAIFGLEEYALRPVYYIDYANVGPVLAQRGRTVQELTASAGMNAADIESALSMALRDPETVRVVPLVSKAGRAGMLIDAQDGTPLRAITVNF